jgi:transposase
MEEMIQIPRRVYEALLARIASLEAEVRSLRAQLSKDSHNSSKPPSSDGFQKPNRTQSQRESSGKKPGGQPGHPGRTLMQRETPDEVVILIPRECDHCGHGVEDKHTVSTMVGRRQVLDLKKDGDLACTEYQQWSCECDNCGEVSRGKYPQWLHRPIQYGPVIQALGVYLSDYMLLPYGRVRECLEDLYRCSISTGTLNRFNRNAYQLLEYVEGLIKQGLIDADVAHFDETGINIKGVLHWLHVASTDQLTHYTIHAKRGDQGMAAGGILPSYQGIAIHDSLPSYYKELFQDMTHGLCNAHLLRNLTFAIEECGDQWAKSMKRCLKQMKETADQARADSKTCIGWATLKRLERRYNAIMARGFTEYPPPKKIPGPKKRGRRIQPFGKNLLDRFYQRKDEVLLFLFDLSVPFDNNQAERDIRMLKVQQKISGCFRSFPGAQYFSRVRAYISTMKKQGFNIMDVLTQAMAGKPPIPNLA